MIDQKAREIADDAYDARGSDFKWQSVAIEAGRLGIIEGLEMAAKRVEAMAAARQAEYNVIENKRSELAREIIARVTMLELAATAIRALIEESKG